ncbi:MAG: efflux RND transporter periplasmic adaptor subunit [Alteromonadaceae bacterium]|nr:efflux RND transporter periplasmic adaptor subunit [Alteromonadaceae bacterium]
MFKLSRMSLVLVAALSSAVLSGCGSESPEQQAAQMTAPPVSVAEVVSLQLSEWDEYSGRLVAPETVMLKPRVSGYVKSVKFTEGALVEKGEVLVEIDPAPFEVEVARLQAAYEGALSRQQNAASELKRGNSLLAQNAIAQEALETRNTALQQAEADVAAMAAALNRAKLELSYTAVKAPLSGRISRAIITQGNFVTAGQSDLTRIVSTRHMHAYFNVDERTYLHYLKNDLFATSSSQSPVLMALADDEKFAYSGEIDFIDNQVNEQTGSITVRASFTNSDHTLLPGLFARVRIAGSKAYDGILIDEKAVGTDLNNKYVLTLKEDNTLEYQPVKLGESLGGLRIVESGLSAGDSIVINGLQRVMPGMQITPRLSEMADSKTIADIQTAQEMLTPPIRTAQTASVQLSNDL